MLNIDGLRVLVNLPLDLTHLVSFLPYYSASFEASRAALLQSAGIADASKYAGEFSMPGSSRTFLDAPFFFSYPSAPDLAQVDVVLVTDAAGMLGLPLLKSYSGPILATEPTIEFGRQMMEELVQFSRSTMRAPDPSLEALAARLKLVSLYGNVAVERLVSRISPVTYRQKVVRCILFYLRDVHVANALRRRFHRASLRWRAALVARSGPATGSSRPTRPRLPSCAPRRPSRATPRRWT